LVGVNAQVGAPNDGDVQPVPVAGGTVLVNKVTGRFNFLEADDYVTDPAGSGVGLGPSPGSTGAEGYGSGSDSYILRAGPAATVALVGQQTVVEAAKGTASVSPLGFSPLGGAADLHAGSAAVSGADLWALVGRPDGCRVVQLDPAPASPQGLVSLDRGGAPAGCEHSAVESDDFSVGVASPGVVQLFRPAAGTATAGSRVPTPFDAGASRIIPVSGASGGLWFLAEESGSWQLFGISPLGGLVGPHPLTGLPPGADPVEPARAGDFLYTLDQNGAGQPTLWTVDLSNGRMAPLRGAPEYPLLSRTEKASFAGAQVVADGPRIVFNNPQSLDAVVVFTDRDRPPVIVDKSRAVAVTTTGPADLAGTALVGEARTSGARGQSDPRRSPVPVVQAVSQQVTCANTTQKPYSPQITAVTPSSGSALIRWSYQLLDQTDCEPASWSVQVRALSGTHQPADPVRLVRGQDQYLFAGLRPATTYQVSVTAYINRQYTPSAPVAFTTAARGPDAPLSVQTRADGLGDWIVSWTPCTEVVNPDCVVPADHWNVVAAACGTSFVGTPPSVEVPGGQDAVTISADDLHLLGDHLSFSVQGGLASGLTGNPSTDRSCTEAWRAPDGAAIRLEGAGTAAPDRTITANLQIILEGDPTTVLGSQPAETELVYRVGGITVGPTNRTDVTVRGLPAGTVLSPTVTVYPAGHDGAAVTITGPRFSQTLAWPADLQAATNAVGTVDPANPNSGSFTVTFPTDVPTGPLEATSPDPADATASGPLLQCGGSAGDSLPFPPQMLQSGRLTFELKDLVDHGGDCVLRLTLTDKAEPNPYGTPSPEISAAFTIGHDPGYRFAEGFSSACQRDGACNPPAGAPWSLTVSTSDDALAAGGDWSVKA
ncbi:MAG TPA: fibronectin type III domain-containing protein, partial [Acidimicrobiales bacterium]|nr:fibronectin type III domain-containing protein [Acidimicrobiales bacterium]